MLDEMIAKGGCNQLQALAMSKFMESLEEAVYSVYLSTLGLKSLPRDQEGLERGIRNVTYMATEILNGVKAHRKSIEHLLKH